MLTVVTVCEVVAFAVTANAALAVPMFAAAVPGLEICHTPESNFVTPAPTVVLTMMPCRSFVLAFAPPSTRVFRPVALLPTFCGIWSAPVPLFVRMLFVALSSSTLFVQVCAPPV